MLEWAGQPKLVAQAGVLLFELLYTVSCLCSSLAVGLLSFCLVLK